MLGPEGSFSQEIVPCCDKELSLDGKRLGRHLLSQRSQSAITVALRVTRADVFDPIRPLRLD